MKKLVLDWDEYTQSRMFILSQVPWVLRGFIYFTLVLVLTILGFIIWGEMEETLMAQGLVRPSANVSIVRAGTSGRIEVILISTGQIVKEGDLLMTLEGSILQSADLSYQSQMRDTLQSLEGWRGLASILGSSAGWNGRPLPADFQSRWESYNLELQRLNIQVTQSSRLLDSEKTLPPALTSKTKIQELTEALDLAQIALKQHKENFSSTIIREIKNLEQNLLSLKTQTAQSKQTLESTQVRAPVGGIIWETGKFNPGETLGAGQEVCRIVPVSSQDLKVELQVLAREGGKMEVGMPIRFRFPAFPYTEFGTVLSEIASISPDSNLGAQGEPYYVLNAELPVTQLLDRKGRMYSLKPGLPAEAWIIIRKRPIWSFLLEKMGFL